jgi:hypothetical protein
LLVHCSILPRNGASGKAGVIQLLFFVSLVIQPSIMDHIASYKDYYFANRRWIFGLLIAIWLWDFVDTIAKGTNHFLNLGTEYPIFNVTHLTGSAVAIITTNGRYHQIYAVVLIFYFVTFMYRTFFVISKTNVCFTDS